MVLALAVLGSKVFHSLRLPLAGGAPGRGSSQKSFVLGASTARAPAHPFEGGRRQGGFLWANSWLCFFGRGPNRFKGLSWSLGILDVGC